MVGVAAVWAALVLRRRHHRLRNRHEVCSFNGFLEGSVMVSVPVVI